MCFIIYGRFNDTSMWSFALDVFAFIWLFSAIKTWGNDINPGYFVFILARLEEKEIYCPSLLKRVTQTHCWWHFLGIPHIASRSAVCSPLVICISNCPLRDSCVLTDYQAFGMVILPFKWCQMFNISIPYWTCMSEDLINLHSLFTWRRDWLSSSVLRLWNQSWELRRSHNCQKTAGRSRCHKYSQLKERRKSKNWADTTRLFHQFVWNPPTDARSLFSLRKKIAYVGALEAVAVCQDQHPSLQTPGLEEDWWVCCTLLPRRIPHQLNDLRASLFASFGNCRTNCAPV